MPSLPPINLPNLPPLTVNAVIDIIIVAVLVYQLLMVMRGRRAFPILVGVLVVGFVYVLATWAHLELLRAILAALAPYTALGLIVMFQSELRRLLGRIGRSHYLGLASNMQRREVAQDIVLAVSQLAQNKVGALIVVERDIGLRTFVESGVALDAHVSRDLLLAIFEKGGALHDGAVIIQGGRIAAAGCFLPLTMNPLLLTQLGTRHRAAIGVTEEADCIAVVVSEETGNISVCAFGEVELDVTPERVEERLSTHTRRLDPSPSKREPYLSEAGTRAVDPPPRLRETNPS